MILDFDIVVTMFNFQSHYYIYFGTNTLQNVWKPHIPRTMGLIEPLLFYFCSSRMVLAFDNLLNWIVWIITILLNWIAWNSFWQLTCVLMLNWIVWNKTDYLYKNGFGIKLPTNIDKP